MSEADLFDTENLTDDDGGDAVWQTTDAADRVTPSATCDGSLETGNARECSSSGLGDAPMEEEEDCAVSMLPRTSARVATGFSHLLQSHGADHVTSRAGTGHDAGRGVPPPPADEPAAPQCILVELLQETVGDAASPHRSVPTEPPAIAAHLLRAYLGISTGRFRRGQYDAIRCVLEGHSALAVFPTGWGKSLCYQYPMLVHRLLVKAPPRGQFPGAERASRFTVVIAPLLSLMEDQTAGIQRSGVLRAVTLSSNSSKEQQTRLLEQLADDHSDIDIVFLSPERLVGNEPVRQVLRRLLHRIAFFCVDEVHCVSQWSHNFRPSFMYIRRAIEDLATTSDGEVRHGAPPRLPPFLCLTATASCVVRDEIRRLFHIDHCVVVDEPRENLRLSSIHVCGQAGEATGGVLVEPTRRHLLETVLNCVQTLPSPMLVYVQTRIDAEEIATYLSHRLGSVGKRRGDRSGGDDGPPAGSSPAATQRAPRVVRAYHAALPRAQRLAAQRAFIDGGVDVLVATVAFGMGIDKADVRTVLHASAPGSLEAYAQEIGRAGRDGEASHCVLLYNPFEYFTLRCRALSSLLSLQEVQSIVACILEAPITRFDVPAQIAVSPAKVAQELGCNQETVETILFMMLTHHPNALMGIHSSIPLGIRIAQRDRKGEEDANDDDDGNDEAEAVGMLGATYLAATAPAHRGGGAPQPRKRSRHSQPFVSSSSVSDILQQLGSADVVLDFCRQHRVVDNVIVAANSVQLPLTDFLYRLQDLARTKKVSYQQLYSGFAIRVHAHAFAELAAPANVVLIAKEVYQRCRRLVNQQIAGLRTMFRVLQSPTHAQLAAALAGEGAGSEGAWGASVEAGAAEVWNPPRPALGRSSAVLLANDFVESNRTRITCAMEAARALAGVMPKSNLSHGSDAGAVPLTSQWYVRDPRFGALREYDFEWIVKVLAPHHLDDGLPPSAARQPPPA